MRDSYITVGEIVNTQGIKGEVRVIPTTDFPERFTKTKKITVLLRNSHKEYNIERVWEHKQFIIIKFAEVNDMTDAEKLKGGLLQITKEELTPLPKDNFYIFDIVGLKVIAEKEGEIGLVKDVIQTGANDVYVVQGAQGKEILIPALKSVVKQVDIPGGVMQVVLPEGLI